MVKLLTGHILKMLMIWYKVLFPIVIVVLSSSCHSTKVTQSQSEETKFINGHFEYIGDYVLDDNDCFTIVSPRKDDPSKSDTAKIFRNRKMKIHHEGTKSDSITSSANKVIQESKSSKNIKTSKSRSGKKRFVVGFIIVLIVIIFIAGGLFYRRYFSSFHINS